MPSCTCFPLTADDPNSLEFFSLGQCELFTHKEVKNCTTLYAYKTKMIKVNIGYICLYGAALQIVSS